MRNFDLTPLYRTTVGFDRLAQMFDQVLTNGEAVSQTYPPYNIEKTGDDAYRITIAVAGFTEAELGIETRDGALVVTGRKAPEAEGRSYLHRGIATRAFERRFQLADHVRAISALTENGLLHIDLVREIPEALKPRRIDIQATQAIEGRSATLAN